MEHIEENVQAAEQAAGMTEAESSLINSLLDKNQKLMDLYCTGCGYCVPCLNDVNIPENFRYMNWHKIWGMEEQAKAAYGRLGPEGFGAPWISGRIEGLNAAACVECGECEPKCPQNIPIIDQLKEVAATLGSA